MKLNKLLLLIALSILPVALAQANGPDANCPVNPQPLVGELNSIVKKPAARDSQADIKTQVAQAPPNIATETLPPPPPGLTTHIGAVEGGTKVPMKEDLLFKQLQEEQKLREEAFHELNETTGEHGERGRDSVPDYDPVIDGQRVAPDQFPELVLEKEYHVSPQQLPKPKGGNTQRYYADVFKRSGKKWGVKVTIPTEKNKLAGNKHFIEEAKRLYPDNPSKQAEYVQLAEAIRKKQVPKSVRYQVTGSGYFRKRGWTVPEMRATSKQEALGILEAEDLVGLDFDELQERFGSAVAQGFWKSMDELQTTIAKDAKHFAEWYYQTYGYGIHGGFDPVTKAPIIKFGDLKRDNFVYEILDAKPDKPDKNVIELIDNKGTAHYIHAKWVDL